jgi:hypothetical protein
MSSFDSKETNRIVKKLESIINCCIDCFLHGIEILRNIYKISLHSTWRKIYI